VTVTGHFKELRSSGIVTTDDEMDTNVATVLEAVLGESSDSVENSVVTVSVESVELQFAFDHFSDVVAISSGSSTAAEDVWGEVMDLLAVLITDDAASGGTGVSCKSDSFLDTINSSIFRHLSGMD